MLVRYRCSEVQCLCVSGSLAVYYGGFKLFMGRVVSGCVAIKRLCQGR